MAGNSGVSTASGLMFWTSTVPEKGSLWSWTARLMIMKLRKTTMPSARCSFKALESGWSDSRIVRSLRISKGFW